MEEEEEVEEEKGPDLKLASRRDMYSICQSAGLGESPLTSRLFFCTEWDLSLTSLCL